MGDLSDLFTTIKKSKHNITFDDLIKLVLGAGYTFKRQKGSHQIFNNKKIAKINFKHAVLSLQPRKGKAKPAQIQEFINRVEDYDLFFN